MEKRGYRESAGDGFIPLYNYIFIIVERIGKLLKLL
jgi:hypothetical protein